MSDLKFTMRPSRVLAKLRAGKPVFSTKCNLADPRAVEIASLFGFDCIWLCREHVPNTLVVCENPTDPWLNGRKQSHVQDWPLRGHLASILSLA